MNILKAFFIVCQIPICACTVYAQDYTSSSYLSASQDFFKQIRKQEKFKAGKYVLDTVAYFDDHIGDVIKTWSDYGFMRAIYHYIEVDSISKSSSRHWKEIDSIAFTKEDELKILFNINSLYSAHWNAYIIGTAQLIDFSIFTATDTVRRNTFLKEGVWVFSYPLFLQDNSVCMFYYLKISLNKSFSALSFFRKENAIWKEFRSVYSSGQPAVE